MRRVALSIASATAVALACAAPSAQATTYTGRLLVSFARPTGTQARTAAAIAVAARADAVPDRSRSIPQLGVLAVRARPGSSLHALAQRLRTQRGVVHVEREGRASLRALPNDPALVTAETTNGANPAIVQEWWALREDLPSLWDRFQATGEKPPLVAIIDSGVDGTHPEISGRVVKSLDRDSTPGDGGPLVDEVGHGTHVASTACANSDNGIGIAGAGLGCNLFVIKSDFEDSSVAKSIVVAADAGAFALNMSFGTDDRANAPAVLRDAVAYAYQRSVVMVAAGSDLATPSSAVTEQGDPANIVQPRGTASDIAKGIGLAVTAAQLDGTRAPFAGSGDEISIAAYGAYQPATRVGPPGLLAAWPATETQIDRGDPDAVPVVKPCNCRTTLNGDNRYAYLQGTSIATPQVTGVAALIRAINPDLSAGDIVRLMKETAARPSGSWTPDLGWGILDGGAAGARAAAIDKHPPSSHVSAPTSSRAQTVTVTISGVVDGGPRGVVRSGVKAVELWGGFSVKGARRLITTTKTTLRVKLPRGHRFRFFTRATDNAGNREPAPKQADASTTVARGD